MPFQTYCEDQYFNSLDFPYKLENYAKEHGIQLGEFVSCAEVPKIKSPSVYFVVFRRINAYNGNYEKLLFTVQEMQNDKYKFSFSFEPL